MPGKHAEQPEWNVPSHRVQRAGASKLLMRTAHACRPSIMCTLCFLPSALTNSINTFAASLPNPTLFLRIWLTSPRHAWPIIAVNSWSAHVPMTLEPTRKGNCYHYSRQGPSFPQVQEVGQAAISLETCNASRLHTPHEAYSVLLSLL
jgi:hypothetical protein